MKGTGNAGKRTDGHASAQPRDEADENQPIQRNVNNDAPNVQSQDKR